MPLPLACANLITCAFAVCAETWGDDAMDRRTRDRFGRYIDNADGAEAQAFFWRRVVQLVRVVPLVSAQFACVCACVYSRMGPAVSLRNPELSFWCCSVAGRARQSRQCGAAGLGTARRMRRSRSVRSARLIQRAECSSSRLLTSALQCGRRPAVSHRSKQRGELRGALAARGSLLPSMIIMSMLILSTPSPHATRARGRNDPRRSPSEPVTGIPSP